MVLVGENEFVREAKSRLAKSVSRFGGGPLRMILQDCKTVEFPENVENNPSNLFVKWVGGRIQCLQFLVLTHHL